MTDSYIPYGHQSIDPSDRRAVDDVLGGEWLTTGPAVATFEDDLSALIDGVPVASVNSGTGALHCAYAALGIGPGDEVITTPLTFAATATAAMHLGAKVVLVDVEDDTLNIDPEAVASAIGPQTRCVSAVDYAGHPADIEALRDAIGGRAALLEDASHSLGATYRGRPVGSLADITTFSFHPVKLVTTAEGGAVAALDPDVVEAVKRFRNHGMIRVGEGAVTESSEPWVQVVDGLGLNYRLPDVLAALGSAQLRRLDDFLVRRRELVERYRSGLQDLDGLRLPAVRGDCEPAWHLFVVRVREGRRREVFEHLRAAEIGVQVHYVPLNLHPLFQRAGYKGGMFPVAEGAYEQIISLPIFPGLTDEQQDRVIGEIRASLRG
jgi:dTDP-4-amino-4,6-dideoxygalactose transaminase